ncbi:hypothetical protein AB0D11_46625 [Streptomyces monashensis]
MKVLGPNGEPPYRVRCAVTRRRSFA